jgi:hypothetical protein
MAPKGHFFTQILQPMHNASEIKAIGEVGDTTMHLFATSSVALKALAILSAPSERIHSASLLLKVDFAYGQSIALQKGTFRNSYY